MKYFGIALVVLVVLGLGAAALIPSFQNNDHAADKAALDASYDLEPLRVRRADSQVETITLADAMAKHHGLDHHHDHADHDHADHEHHAGDVCIGVGVGYQAVRYTCQKLFPNEIPASNDLELASVGNMRGTWDLFDLFLDKTHTRPVSEESKMSLSDFVFTAKRRSTGKTVTFRLRKNILPREFFQMKNQGIGCDNQKLRALKQQAVNTLLTNTPEDCFETCPKPKS